MKKTFESFVNSQNLDLEKIERLLNDKKLLLAMENLFHKLPNSWKDKLLNYFQDDIDLDKLFRFNDKFKIIEKTIELYQSGVKNIKDIYSRIIPNNESLLFTITFILMFIGMCACFFGLISIADLIIDFSREKMLVTIFLVAVGVLGCWGGIKVRDYDDYKESQFQEIKFNIKKENKKRTITVNIDENGEYTVSEEESNW